MKRIKYISVLAVLLLMAGKADAQNVLLSEGVEYDSLRPVRGQNLKHFKQFYAGSLFVIPQLDPASEKVYGISMTTQLGFRYKRKINNHLAWGYELEVKRLIYSMSQDTPKVMNNSVKFEAEEFRLGNIEGGLYLRINFGIRGNIIGRYIDLCGFGGLNFARNYYVKQKVNAQWVRKWYLQQGFIEPFQYGAGIRIGVNRYSILCNYRVSDLLKLNDTKDVFFPNLEAPRITVGFQVGLYR